MGETMARFLDADSAVRLEHLAQRPDRPLVKPLTVLVSASGAPGTAALLRGLRENGEREVRLVGTDMSERSIGRHLCDAFHLVPAGADPGFPDAILDVCAREGVDAVLPQSSFDLEGLAEHKQRFADAGIAVLVASPGRDPALERQGGVLRVPAADRRADDRLPARQRRRRRSRPPRASSATPTGRSASSPSSRRARAASASSTRPSTARTSCCTSGRARSAMRLEEAVELIGDDPTDLLVMELATGGERTIDGIADGGRIALGHPKTREAMRAGLAMYFVTLDDPQLMEIADRIAAELALDHFFNIQLVGDAVIEINPRISTIVYQDDLDIPYLGRQARARRALVRGARRRCARASGRAAPRFDFSIRWNGTRHDLRPLRRAGRRRVARDARPEGDEPLLDVLARARRRPRRDAAAQALAAAELVASAAGEAPDDLPQPRPRVGRAARRARRGADRARAARRPRRSRSTSGCARRTTSTWCDAVRDLRFRLGDLAAAAVRVTHAPGQHGGHPVGERRGAAPARRRRAARRLQPLPAPPRGRPRPALPAGLLRRQPRQWAALAQPAAADRRLPLLLRADARAEVAAVPDPARGAEEVASTTSSAPTGAARRRSSSPTRSAPTRGSSAPSPRSRRPDAELVPPGLDLRPFTPVPPSDRERPLVVHAPSDRRRKGTEHVIAACEQLPVDLDIVEGAPPRGGARALPPAPTSSSTS